MRYHLHSLAVFLIMHLLVTALLAAGQGWLTPGEGETFFLAWAVFLLSWPALLMSFLGYHLVVPVARRWAGLAAPVAAPARYRDDDDSLSGLSSEPTFDGSPVRNGRDMYMDLPGTRDPLD